MRAKIMQSLAVLAMLFAGTAAAQTKPEITAPKTPGLETFMYVGNSFFYYNNGLPGYVTRLVNGAPAAQKRKNLGTMVTIGGSGFDWHDMESYFRPHAVGYYNFDDHNNIIFNTRKKPYDAVVMMDCSQCPIHPQLSSIFVEYAKKNAEIARSHDVEPMLFMSWAYQDHPEMTAQLAEAYTKAGNDNHELVIPAGLAFARVFKERADLNLYQPDKRHPTLIGTYLAAAVVYSALYQQSPEENSYTAGLDPAVAQYLRRTAWDVARAYYGK
jgi:hypothetical protein